MKRSILIFVVLMLAVTVKAQDFWTKCESGQTLYYKIIDKTNNYVAIVYPGYDFYAFPGYRPQYAWDGFTTPAGDVIIPQTIENKGITYTVVGIYRSAFNYCKEMTSIYIPSTVTKIDTYNFDGCIKLAEIRVSPENPVFDSRDNCNAIIDTPKNELVRGCNGTVIPNTVVTIAMQAFRGSGIKEISFPSSVEFIGSSAFYNCKELTAITIPSTVIGMDNEPFDSDRVTASLTTTPLKLEAGKYRFDYYYDEDGFAYGVCIVPCGMKDTYENSDWSKFFNFDEDCNEKKE